MAVTVNIGPAPSNCMWTAVARVLAMTSGINDRDFELKQQQLNGKNYARNRRIESCRHARRRSAGQQNFALRSRGMKNLPHQRPDGAAGLNNRPFRAERTASANRDSRRDRLQDCHPRLNPAAIEKHRLHGLGNAVSLDLR